MGIEDWYTAKRVLNILQPVVKGLDAGEQAIELSDKSQELFRTAAKDYVT